MKRSMLLAVSAIGLAACGASEPSAEGPTAQVTMARLIAGTPDPDTGFDPAPPLPAGVPRVDQEKIRLWHRQNELCRGSPDARTIEDICPKRDHTQQELERRGWCWGNEDPDAYPTAYQWHRCTDRRTSGAQRARSDEAPAVVPIAQEPTPQIAKPRATGEAMVLYQHMIEPAVRAAARYEADQQCIGLPGYEGRSSLQRHMRQVNARYFPQTPGLWSEAGSWAARLLDRTREEEKKHMCVTFDAPRPRDQVITVHRAQP